MNKKSFFCITMLFISLSTYATAQEGDVIYIDGVQWILLGKPVYADSVLSRELKEALPKDRGWSTANWSGYTAYWSIWKDKLCLDSVQYMIYDGSDRLGRTESLPSKTLRRLFKKYVEGKRIVATWLDGDIRVAKGKMIYYVHDGYRRNYDEYHPEANPPRQFPRKRNSDLPEMFPLHIEQYPELAGQKRIVFSVRRAQVDATGHLVDCEIRVLRPGDNPKLAAEMAEAMKAYYPWRVMFINGEYKANGIEGYTFPYPLDGKE